MARATCTTIVIISAWIAMLTKLTPPPTKNWRNMDHFAGLDVSVKETSICIVDDTGRIVREVKVASEPEALLQVLTNNTYRFKRVGLEAGPLSQWLFSALAEAGLPVICVETRYIQDRSQ